MIHLYVLDVVNVIFGGWKGRGRGRRKIVGLSNASPKTRPRAGSGNEGGLKEKRERE